MRFTGRQNRLAGLRFTSVLVLVTMLTALVGCGGPKAVRGGAGTDNPALDEAAMSATSQHIEDQMSALLSSIETYLVNSGDVRVVSRERQQKLVNELRRRGSDIYDPQTIGTFGRQLGAQYLVTGKITSVEERLQKTRRVQYSLAIQVLEVETGLIVFQNEAARSKALKR